MTTLYHANKTEASGSTTPYEQIDRTGVTTVDRLALQNLINAYCQETRRGTVALAAEQSKAQRQISGGAPVLLLTLHPLSLSVMVPIARVTKLGQQQLLDCPYVLQDGMWVRLSAVTLAGLIIDDIIDTHPERAQLDGAEVLERWLQSRTGLETILSVRGDGVDEITQPRANFIESEQALIYGHAMHPTPKSRVGFDAPDWVTYSPETKGCFQLTYWLVDPRYITEEFADGDSITEALKTALIPLMDERQQALLTANPSFKLLPLHPWQAQHLQKQPWFARLQASGSLYDLGALGWQLSATTSVRTLCAFDAPWMFKLSLSVAITNSVRINLPKECKRGLHACRIWRSEFGQQMQTQYPTLKVLNDPAWIALTIDGQIVDESICILRDNPFSAEQQVSSMASLCQDHPNRQTNRIQALFDQIYAEQPQPYADIARTWFARFLAVAVEPMFSLYHDHGLGFEAHQQNSMLELEDGYPKHFWVRDNQGFGYIIEYASALIEQYPELEYEAQCIVPVEFADARVSYYFVGNTLFGMMNAIAQTGAISEDTLLSMLGQTLQYLQQKYPDSSILAQLLHATTLPYKGNLMTRLYQIDELIAPVEVQSVYVEIPNPIRAVMQPETALVNDAAVKEHCDA